MKKPQKTILVSRLLFTKIYFDNTADIESAIGNHGIQTNRECL